MKHEYVECDCSCACHTLRFTWDPDPEYPEVYVSMFLGHFGFFRRLWLAIKYLFGFKCSYGHFCEAVLIHSQLEKIRFLCDGFLRTHGSVVESSSNDESNSG